MSTRRRLIVLLSTFALAGFAHAADSMYGAREGSILGGPAPGTQARSWDWYYEGFEDITTLSGDGWFLINNSGPQGTTNWFQGNSAIFPASNGLPDEYIAANYNNCGAGSPEIISNWLISPEFDFTKITEISFVTRTAAGSNWPDRLQVRASRAGSSTHVGTSPTSVGDFTLLLEDINPDYQLGGFPEAWSQFDLNAPSGAGGNTGRIALRYFVESAGPAGVNSNYIGIDVFQAFYNPPDGGGIPPVPAIGAWGVIFLLAAVLIVSVFVLRRRSA